MDRTSARYMADYVRRSSQLRYGTIVASLGSDEWTVRLNDTQHVVTATAESGAIYVADQPVILTRVDSAGRGKGTGWVLTLAPTATIPVTRYADTVTLSEETVTYMPESVTLEAGGAAEEVPIRGVGLTTTPTYGSPKITDDSAPSVTATLITLHVKAAADCAPGTYSLTVAGMTVPAFFIVT